MAKHRECNGCKHCCYLFVVPEMNKPMKEYCKHCCDQGCAIHDQERPPICTDFLCCWAKHPNIIPEEFRPDRCGIIFRTSIYKGIVHLRAIAGSEFAFYKPKNKELIENLKRKGYIIAGIVNDPALFVEDNEPQTLIMRCWADKNRYPWLTEKIARGIIECNLGYIDGKI